MPAADPFDIFRRDPDPFSVFRRSPQAGGVDPTEEEDEWEDIAATVQRNRRTGETRPKPIPGGLEAVGPVAEKGPSLLGNLGARFAENTMSYVDMAAGAVGGLLDATRLSAPDPLDVDTMAIGDLRGLRRLPPPELPGLAAQDPEDLYPKLRAGVRQRYEEAREATASGERPVASALLNTGLDLAADPGNIPGVRIGRGLARGAEAAFGPSRALGRAAAAAAPSPSGAVDDAARALAGAAPPPRAAADAEQALIDAFDGFLRSKGLEGDAYYRLPKAKQMALDAEFELRGGGMGGRPDVAPEPLRPPEPSESSAGSWTDPLLRKSPAGVADDYFTSKVVHFPEAGDPGLSSAPAGATKQHVLYRDQQGRVVTFAVLERQGDEWSVVSLATDKTRGALGARGAVAVGRKVAEFKPRLDLDNTISPDAQRLLTSAVRRGEVDGPTTARQAAQEALGAPAPAPAMVAREIGPPAGAGEAADPFQVFRGGSESTAAAPPPPSSPTRGSTSPTPASAAVAPAPPMSTKGLENVAGMKDEFQELVAQNRDAIAAARGPVKPVSRWHDGAALARDLGMEPDDFLSSPAGRVWSDDELALGRHYLGGLKQQVNDLAGRLARGEIPEAEREAAREALARQNVDIVRMMSTLQGQGLSVYGRGLRQAQEALDPMGLASTPKEKLQLALLKHYGTKNAGEAAKVEARAVAKLQRQAAFEARKLGRQVTREELAQEFQALSSEWGRISRTPRTGLDPELVALIGKMASNRIKAGVVAVEQLADEIFQVAAQHVEGIRREDVKAAIVEHALAKPRKAPLAAQKVKAAEARAQKVAEDLEARVAAGGAPAPGPTSSPWSAKLAELKARQAAAREQLAEMRKAGRPPQDPAARKLAAAEKRAAKQVEVLEARIAAGPQKPKGAPAPLDSPRLQALRQRAADLKAQIGADPREGLAARYRELLDDQTVEMIARLPDPAEDPAALVGFLRQMEKPTFRDFRTTYWINSILSGTKTLSRNLVGNAVRLGELTVMRPAGAVVEQSLARLQGRAPERYVRETLPATVGVFRGIPEGLKRFAFVLRQGYDPGKLVAELTEGAGSKFDQRLPVSPFVLSQRRGVRAAGAVVTLPTRILEATDAMAKVMAATSERYAWATRQALKEGALDVAARVADLLVEQPEEMLQAQRAFALRATYQDPMSWVGSAASAIRRGVPGADKLSAELRGRGGASNRALATVVDLPGVVGQHLLPFIHISDRVAAAVTDYIPGAKPAKLARLVAEQSPEAADLIARQVVGGGLTMLGITWAAEGKLTGAAPRDEKLKNDFYATGKQPYSLLVGDRWVPMRDALGPFAGPFVVAAAYNDARQVGEDPTPALAGMALGTSRYLLDASYMATLQQVVESVEAGEAKGGRGIVQAGARVVGGYVPYSGLLRNVAVSRDPRVVEKEGFLDELRSGLPGLREELPARIGTLGEELVQNTGAAGGFLPIVPTENLVADPALAEEVERLRSTVQRRGSDINRVLEGVKDARRAKDKARVQALLATLPPSSDRAQPKAALARVRGLEAQLRRLRADERLPEEQRRAREVAIQQQMRDVLARALGRVEGRDGT